MNIFFYITFALFMGATTNYHLISEERQTQKSQMALPWFYSYSEGIAHAKKTNTPIYLLFTGPEWCSFCRTMDKAIHSSSEFIKKVEGKCTFIQIVLPKIGAPSTEIQQLIDRFQISSVPTEILITADGSSEIARFGYTRMSPSDFADEILGTFTHTNPHRSH